MEVQVDEDRVCQNFQIHQCQDSRTVQYNDRESEVL